jgi:hypothetical protein
MKRVTAVSAVLIGFALGAVMGHLAPVHAQYAGQAKVYITEDTSPGFGSLPVSITGSQVVGFSCIEEKDDSQKCYIASMK